MAITQDQIDEWIKKWQPLLRLADWNIKTKLYRAHQMSIDDAEGSCAVTFERRMAFIEIRDPNDSPVVDSWGTPDPEHAIVHELLHCHFHAFIPTNRESLEFKMAEQTIDSLATSFIEIDRKSSKP